MVEDELNGLQEIVEYKFSNVALLAEALQHASYDATTNYQRLEFVGDRVLGLIVAELLFRHFPGAPEGTLAPRLNALVRRATLAEIACSTGLKKYLRISSGEEQSGGREKPALLADICEAVIGALYLDGGLEPAKKFVETHWLERIKALDEAPVDAKTSLQEWAQARGLSPPDYIEIAQTGPAHAPRFTIEARIPGQDPVRGEGTSKRAAQQAAASAFLARLDLA